MVTGRRRCLAIRAARCFAQQTYSDKELVVVCDGDEDDAEQLRADLNALGIEHRFVYAGPSVHSLGALRNLSLRHASGQLVCQWDDDDWVHPDRLRVQIGELLATRSEACFLTEHLHYVESDASLAWIDWAAPNVPFPASMFPGSLLAWRSKRLQYPESGPSARKGEDSVLLERLCAECNVLAVRGLGFFYMYTYHGNNTFSAAHHQHLRNYALDSAQLFVRRAEILEAILLSGIERTCRLVGRVPRRPDG